MSKLTKNLGICLIGLSGLATPHVSADVIQTVQDGTDYYLLDDTNNSIYHYDMTSGGTDITRLFGASDTPTTFAYDGTNFFMAYDNTIWSLTSGGAATLLRNTTSNAKKLIVAGDYVIALLGDDGGDNVLMSLEKADGDIVDTTPSDADDFATIKDIFYDATDGRIIIQLDAANDDGTEFVSADFDAGTGLFSNFGTIDANDFTGLGSPFYLDDKRMLVDENGQLIDFSVTPITFNYQNDDTNDTTIVNFTQDKIATDSTITTASDSDNFFYIATTLDNSCNPVAEGGKRITRYTTPPVTVSGDYYYDTANAIHSIATSSSGTTDTIYLFHGSGSALEVEIVTNTNFETPITPWLDPYVPTDASYDTETDEVYVASDNTTLLFHVDDGCYHHVQFWDTTTNAFAGHTETYWEGPTHTAYVANHDRYYLAHELDSQPFLFAVDTTQPESTGGSSASVAVYANTDSINYLIDAGDFLVVHATGDSGDEIRSHSIANLAASSITATTDETDSTAIENCCDTWTRAVYDSTNQRIYFTTSDGLFAIGIDGAGTFSGPDAGAALSSGDFGTWITSSGDGNLSINSDGSRLFLEGSIYDTTDLSWIDTVSTTSNIGFFSGTNLFTIAEDGSTDLEQWTFDQGSDNHLGLETTSEVEGTPIALLPILSEGSTTPLTLATLDNDQLSIAKPLTTEDASSVGEDDGTGTSDGGTSDTEAETTGSACTGICNSASSSSDGGSTDNLILLALLGLALRARVKQ